MKNKFNLLFIFAIALSVFLVSCSENTIEPNIGGDKLSQDTVTTDNSTTTTKTPKIIPEPVNGVSFADNLMIMTADDGNRMISPYSAKMCLALLANGANGETKTQILNAIGITDIDEYNSSVKELLERYASYAGVMSLETANSLWLNQSVFGGDGAFLAPYRNAMQEFYSAEVREVTSANSIEEVNSWVNDKTNSKIKDILTEDHRNFATALVNAVYFKAAWENEFYNRLTKELDFNNIDGSTSKLDFMHNTDYYGYYDANGVTAVKIDYGRFGENEKYIRDRNYDFSMYIMLADELNVEAFLNEAMSETADTATFSSKRVSLSIPKFKLEYSLGLNEILMALGMVDAYDVTKADFSKMIDLSTLNDNLIVSDVLQKTYIGIDEVGTEAAAVTAIVMAEGSAIEVTPPIEFKADKPFYFAIRDNTSGELLFVGRYETGK